MDGSNIETLVINNNISNLALDVDGGKIYWINDVYWPDDVYNFGGSGDRGDKIRRANLDGSNIETLVLTENRISDIILDSTEGKMYWADTKNFPNNEHKIRRANLDGSNIETLFTVLDNYLHGLALDVDGGKIYWTEIFVSSFGNYSKIQRANLDGSSIETLVKINNTPGLSDLALDLSGGKIYWADADEGKIQRANLDGSNIETLFTTEKRSNGVDNPLFGALGGFYEPPNTEETRTRSPEEARSELSERSIPYSQRSFVTYAQNGDLDVVRLFNEAGMDVNVQPYSSSVAHIAETEPDGSLVAVWFPQPGDEDNNTALMKAAGQGHIEVVRFLVDQGADLKIRNGQDQDALMFAAAGGHLAVAIFLIDRVGGVPPTLVLGGYFYDSGPQTALEWAAYNGHLDMVHILLENIDIGISRRPTASLGWAAYRGHLDVGRLLLEYGAFVDVNPFGIGWQGPTPLMLAAYSGQLDMVRLLLDHGADFTIGQLTYGE